MLDLKAFFGLFALCFEREWIGSMLYRWKFLTIILVSGSLSLWWFFGVNNDPSDDSAYPRALYVEDISKIYFDLGCLCEMRGDRGSAATAYQTALSHNKDHDGARNHLDALGD